MPTATKIQREAGQPLPTSGGAYSSPAQYQADLHTVSGGGWTLTDHVSQSISTFSSSGRLHTVADRDSNLTTFSYGTGAIPMTVTSSRGGTGGDRVLNITMAGSRISTLTQTSGSLSRTVTLGYSANGHLASVTDASNGVTQFGDAADDGQVLSITNPDSATTTLTFSGAKVASVTQSNAAGAGTSTTRLTYPTATQTLVADATTDQGSSVASVPHTTYNLISAASGLVGSATDADGHTRSRTYTPFNDVATTTGAIANEVTSGTFTSNSGESLNNATSPTGAAGQAGYGTGGTAYLPTSTTDSTGNVQNVGYSPTGDPMTRNQGASGPQAIVGYTRMAVEPSLARSPRVPVPRRSIPSTPQPTRRPASRRSATVASARVAIPGTGLGDSPPGLMGEETPSHTAMTTVTESSQ